MTVAYPRVLAAIKAKSSSELLSCFQGLSPSEVVELGTFVGYQRLYAVMQLSAGTFDLSWLDVRRPPAMMSSVTTTFALRELLAETYWQAYGNSISSSARGPSPAMLIHTVAIALADIARRRDAALLLTIDADPTGTLPPNPTAAPAALSEADYAASALRNQVSVPAIKAVAKVESGGRSGFDAQGRPKILFEAHHFGPLTQNMYDKTHPHLSCPNTKAARTKARKYYAWNQYERLMEAILLNEEAALSAASWGKFQVLGEYHDGWPDVRSFVAAMYESEANHLKAFEAHCGPRLFAALRRKDWTAFAKGYNGPSQVGYDTQIGAAYTAAGGR